ncbi:hypothetical protein GCM10022197_42130 [Microlunatus spumicola]|uniref:Lipoprotein n=1 Tax=Microlunatus spumicola TaxID=81499 RepID=A0ABP6YBY7_9ACTN
MLVVLLALVVPAGCASGSAADVDDGRPFAADSPFNVAVPAGAALDPGSAAMVARATRRGEVTANLYAYGVPVYHAGRGDPAYDVTCTRDAEWGPCPLGEGRRRIPVAAVPSTGTDGALVVVQEDGSVDEYWQARRTGSSWTASYGAVNSLGGSGWGGSSTGAGASRLAGVVRLAEVRSGTIDHALALQTDDLCAGVVRPPALKTDGDSDRSDCLPAGARLQLDPSLDLSTVRGLGPGERAVARALQVYGGYVMDRSGAPLSVSFEVAGDATPATPGSVYRAAGLEWDYYGMPHVPWHRLRVLAG